MDCCPIFCPILYRVQMEGDNMVKETWVVEANLDSVDLFEYRITALDRRLKTNAVRLFLKINDLSMKWQEPNWIVVAVACSEEEAHQKAERLKRMTISEKDHLSATGESLYLNL